MVGATMAVGLLELGDRYDLSVVDPLPQGLPSFAMPDLSPSNLGTLAAGALGIALVSFADTSVLSRTFALGDGYKVNPNQEPIALGSGGVADAGAPDRRRRRAGHRRGHQRRRRDQGPVRRELAAAGVELRFAEVKDPVKDRLDATG